MKNQLIAAENFLAVTKNTVYLFNGLWKEKTTMLLHGHQDVDKIAKAIEIARCVSDSGRKIAYINVADKLNDHAEKLLGIKNMAILNPTFESADETSDYADIVISLIEQIIAETDIRVFIIDSVSRIAALSFGRNASAAYIMKRLVNLQMRSGCSFLVVADDSTKSADRALRVLVVSEMAETVEPTETLSPSEVSDASDVASKPLPRKQLSRSDRRKLRRATQQSAINKL